MITLLHLSDLQFGKHHRFGNGEGLKLLTLDLDLLAERHDLRPEVLVVTGDLAEWGRKAEFKDALLFLESMTEYLELDRHRVVVVPGNHDVNRTLCQNYWAECEEEGTPPREPYWDKLRFYTSMIHSFYCDVPGVDFTENQPWTLYEMPELSLVVAGLNSAMAESHELHCGELGRQQLEWFAEHLAPYRENGWFRIGAVHHNVLPGYASEDESLRDHTDLKNILGRCLNLVLHGHTHAADVGSLRPGVPILSTGSAGLTAEARPDVPNQYQVIRIEAGRLVRYCRQYAPDRGGWIADPRISESGEDWKEEVRLVFMEVGKALPAAEARDAPSGTPELPTYGERPPVRDGFLAAVEEICRQRARENAEIREIARGTQIPYLAVRETIDEIVNRYAVGAWTGTVDGDMLDVFLAIHQRYRRTDAGVRSTLVYSGDPPTDDVLSRARGERVRLRSFVEYQGLIDFRPYVARQTRELAANKSYPPNVYVDQRMRYTIGLEEHETDNALARILEWLLDDHGRFILILGEFGTGKTFLLRETARRLGEQSGALVPIFIEMRDLEKGRTLDELVAQHFAAKFDRIDFKAFRYMLREGRIVLFFDGFDELVLRVTYDQATEHFRTLLEAAAGDAKVVVTSRTQHFESDRQVRTALGEQAGQLAGHRIVHLRRFDSRQIRSYLRNRLGHPVAAERRFKLIGRIKDLMGLSQVPRMLGFITDLPEEALIAAEKTGAVRAADLYAILLDVWIVHEAGRLKPKGGPPTLTEKHRWAAVEKLAIRLWRQTESFVNVSDLKEEAAALEELADSPISTGVAAQQFGSGTLLVRDSEGAFSFVHQSILEWLVARRAAREFKEKGSTAILGVKMMSPLMAEFFRDMAAPEKAAEWVHGALEDQDETIKKNALVVRERLEAVGVVIETALHLTGQDLRGQDFSKKNLDGADLTRADLASAKLVAASLKNARLGQAKFTDADLAGADLRGADLRQANLSRASLMGADLRGAKLAGSVLWRAKLVGAQLDEEALDQSVISGAALPDRSGLLAWHGMSEACNTVAWCPQREILATGHDDGVIHLWDTISKKEIRMLTGHQSWVTSVCFDQQGAFLASGSYDKTVRVWDVCTGEPIEVLRHDSGVTCICFSPDGQLLASGSTDKTIHVWDMSSEGVAAVLEGHLAKVNSVCFHPDGSLLASCSDDRTIMIWSVESRTHFPPLKGHFKKVTCLSFNAQGTLLASGSADKVVCLWNARSGKELLKLRGHQEVVNDVAFDPSGLMIASAANDRTIRLWQVSSGEEIHVLSGHRQPINSVCYSPDGSSLAGGSYDKTVRLWDAASGRETGTLAGRRNAVTSVCVDEHGQFLACGCEDHTVHLWNMESLCPIHRIHGHEGKITGLAFSLQGSVLISSSEDGTVRLWKTGSGEPIRAVKVHMNAVTTMSIDSSGTVLAAGSFDNSIRLWGLRVDSVYLVEDAHENVVTSLCVSSDGDLLASGSYDNKVKVWKVKLNALQQPTIKKWRTLVGHGGNILSVSLSSGASHLASGSEDSTARIWSVGAGTEIHTLKGHRGQVSSVSFSPDDSLLASGSYDTTVRLWDVDSGMEQARLQGHQNVVRSVQFSPDGSRLVSGSDDNSVRIWDVAGGRCLAVLVLLPEGWIAYTPDGRFKLGGDVAGAFWHSIGLCRFEPGELDSHLAEPLRVSAHEPLIVALQS